MQKLKEKDVQNTILEYLRLKKYFCWKNNTVGIYKQSTGQYIPSQNVGSPDIFVVVPRKWEVKDPQQKMNEPEFYRTGQIYGIEVKVGNNKQSDYQQAWQKNFEASGGIYILAFTLEDVQRYL